MAKKTAGKFGVRKQQQFLKLLEEGSRRGAAASQVGISYVTVWRRIRDDQDFADLVDSVEMKADEEVEDALREAALSGNVTACQVWLYNRQPERWADKRQQKLEHSAPGGGPLETVLRVEWTQEPTNLGVEAEDEDGDGHRQGPA